MIIEGWRVRKSKGILWMPRPGCDRVLEIDLVHGYAECPGDLYPTIAAIASEQALDPRVTRDQAGPFSQDRTNLTTLSSWLDRDKATTMARYALGPLP